MPRVSVRWVVVALIVLVGFGQLTAVTLASLPPNRYSEAARPHVTYLQPYFAQNWRLFAPNPVTDDRMIRFQGSYVDADGTSRLTPWVDWTEVELDLIRHRLVGGRAGYITNKMFSPRVARWSSLGTASQTVAQRPKAEDPPSWKKLHTELIEAGGQPATVIAYLRFERSTAQLATDVLLGRWPDRRFTGVRYALRRHAVVPYSARHLSGEARAAARPGPRDDPSGWRIPTPGGATERRAVADFDRRHRP